MWVCFFLKDLIGRDLHFACYISFDNVKKLGLYIWIGYTIFAWFLLPLLFWLVQPSDTPQYLAKVTTEFGIVPWIFASVFGLAGWLFHRWWLWSLKEEQQEKLAEKKNDAAHSEVHK